MREKNKRHPSGSDALCYLKLMSLVAETVEFQRYSVVISANSSVGAEENSDLHQVRQGQECRPLAPWPLLAHLCHIAVLTSAWRDSSLWPPIDSAPSSLLLFCQHFPHFQEMIASQEKGERQGGQRMPLGLEGKCSGLKFWTDEQFGHG